MNTTLFCRGLETLGGTAQGEQLEKFCQYSALLKEWNQRMNLTAITQDDEITVKHYLDSLLPLYHMNISQGAAVADIGTGAGFPGIPFKIMRPDLRLTLIDSLNKRVTFLNHVTQQLGLEDVLCLHGRAEDLGRDKSLREIFDVVTSRAVAELSVLSEYCIPFVKPGGCFVALKAEGVQQELDHARPMIGNLGGSVEAVISAPLPFGDAMRQLVVIRKTKSTPAGFPRRSSRIKKAGKNG